MSTAYLHRCDNHETGKYTYVILSTNTPASDDLYRCAYTLIDACPGKSFDDAIKRMKQRHPHLKMQ